MSRIAICLILTVASVAVPAAAARGGPRWSRGPDGRIRVEPVPVERRFRNADWPKDWEEGFWDRANYVVAQVASDGRYGGTYFEQEKRSYGWAMLSVLGGFEEPAMQFLQAEDPMAEAWNKHTLGIDLFPCFTLKQQVRKYFFFGEAMEPDYRERMKRAVKLFTEKDPLGRPHHAYAGKTGWGPDAKNSWVDVRSTDNLKLMRDTAVYLFAEESGNEEVRRLYKEHLRQFVVTMYYQGMGEWDSENYLGHSIAPMLNLYDFARDPEVKLLAKAALDAMAAAGAVKYWRGGFNGPTCRDYNHPYPFGGSAAALTWLWFGDAPQQPEEFEPDEIHPITSAYRPPQAVVHLARKDFARPKEIFAGKPQWAAWRTPDAAAPTYRETHYFGRTFQFGTLARGTQNLDVNGFKILVHSSRRGAETIMAAPIDEPLRLGSPQYQEGILAHHSAVGQNGNMAIYLTGESDKPYLFLVPEAAEIVERAGVTFVRCERTTIALWPINLTSPQLDRGRTERVQYEVRTDRDGKEERHPRWIGSKILAAERREPGHYGFAIEIDEGNAERFIEAASKLRPETDEVPVRGAAAMTAVSGRRVRLQWGDTLAAVHIWRDGKLRQWESPEEMVAYRTLDGRLIDQSWQGDGTLRVSAGGRTFTCTVARDGRVSFEEGTSAP